MGVVMKQSLREVGAAALIGVNQPAEPQD